MDEQAQRVDGRQGRRWSRDTRLAAGAVAGAIAVAAVLAGCSASGDSPASANGGASVAAAPQPGDASRGVAPGTGTVGGLSGQPADGTATSADGGTTTGTGVGPTTKSPELSTSVGVLADRSIVRTAAVTVRVKDVLVTSAKAEALAEGLGGFVSGEKTQASPDQPDKSEAVVTLRVPADRLPSLLVGLRGLGTLLSEDQSADDVTGQVIDVAARIAAQKASVARIRVLMARANTLGQVVQIEGELTQRQAALESLQGQAAALADQTTLATATITLVGPKAPAPATHHATPTPTGFGAGLSRGWHAFSVAGSWLLTAIGVLLPFLLVLAPLGIALYVLARRRTKVVAAPGSSEPPPAAA